MNADSDLLVPERPIDRELCELARLDAEASWAPFLAGGYFTKTRIVRRRGDIAMLRALHPHCWRTASFRELRRRFRVYEAALYERHWQLADAANERDPAKARAAVREGRHPLSFVAGATPGAWADALERAGAQLDGHALFALAHMAVLERGRPGLLDAAVATLREVAR